MNIYVVGGAVRDDLMGQASNDADYVVVGSDAPTMQALGYLPVGADFPVFLHPKTKAEYALARTERKNGTGYHGFVFYADKQVTLEQDLLRRDLTINAMARPLKEGFNGSETANPKQNWQEALIDPYGGQQDVENGILRHVSPAFAEDPVRILRIARFLARWPHMRVADETEHLCRCMVAAGEVNHLVAERVWQEVSRGLQEPLPYRMFAFLQQINALPILIPSVSKAIEASKNKAVAIPVFPVVPNTKHYTLTQAYGLLSLWVAEVGNPHDLHQSLKVPRDLVQMSHMLRHVADNPLHTPNDYLNLFNQTRAWQSFSALEQAFAILHEYAHNTHIAKPLADMTLLKTIYQAACQVSPTKVIATLNPSCSGEEIAQAISAARLKAISLYLTDKPAPTSP